MLIQLIIFLFIKIKPEKSEEKKSGNKNFGKIMGLIKFNSAIKKDISVIIYSLSHCYFVRNLLELTLTNKNVIMLLV